MLKLDHVKKKYRDFTLDCSIEVKPGYITGLIGKNGAGKSTTFKAILGLINPDSGSIEIFGKDSTSLKKEDRAQIGAVLTDAGFNELLTPEDLIPILENLYPDFNRQFFLEKLKTQSLPLNKKIREFSTGMKAKLKVLIALSLGVKLLILDEPTIGLDVIARNEILDLLRDYMVEDESRSILISSHNSNDLKYLCDDLYLIDNGKIILHEDTDTILNNYALIKVRPEEFSYLDKSYILSCKNERIFYKCLTDQKQFYQENYPNLIIEPGSIDDVLTLILTGEK